VTDSSGGTALAEAAPEPVPPPKSVKAQKDPAFDRSTRRLWPLFSMPGTIWLILLFVVPFYGVFAVAFGQVDFLFNTPIPAWNPLHWQFTLFGEVLHASVDGPFSAVWRRTFGYVIASLIMCVAIGYPVAYYVARLAGRRRGLLLALILAPWWINYITRMLGWMSILDPSGPLNRLLLHLGVINHPINFLGGYPAVVVLGLVYGYLPFFIVPLYASLDRIDQRLLEASRDLGVGSVRTFFHVTLPLSRMGLITALVITALPMAGDYYTNQLLSGAPKTTMIGNTIYYYLGQGSQKNVGACLVIQLSLLLLVFMAYYLLLTQRAAKEASR
jgi:ABC-type spermidine/putrescine transport system permease subunit I